MEDVRAYLYAHAQTKPYWSPYVAGVAIGLTLLATYVLMGHGLGASGAYATATAKAVGIVAPTHAAKNSYFQSYLQAGPFFTSWIVVEVLGILLGGFLGAVTAHRFQWTVERGPTAGQRGRLLFAALGGIVTGFGSRLALGCTSGQALSGSAVLALGSWIFTLAFFVGGFATAWMARRQWR